MTAAFSHVYLSPHLDDVALSCGGAIAAQRARGERVLVVTLCTGAPPAERALPAFVEEAYRAHGTTAAQLVEARHAEDRRAMEILGVEFEWVGALDAIYRLPERYGSLEELFGRVAHADPLVAEAARVARVIAPGALLHAPLGIGGHVDHRIAHAAACTAARPVVFYEDFPYVTDPGALDRRLAELGEPLVPEVTDVSATLDRRIEAILAYPTQVWLDAEAVRLKVETHARSVAGSGLFERSWARPVPCTK